MEETLCWPARSQVLHALILTCINCVAWTLLAVLLDLLKGQLLLCWSSITAYRRTVRCKEACNPALSAAQNGSSTTANGAGVMHATADLLTAQPVAATSNRLARQPHHDMHTRTPPDPLHTSCVTTLTPCSPLLASSSPPHALCSHPEAPSISCLAPSSPPSLCLLVGTARPSSDCSGTASDSCGSSAASSRALSTAASVGSLGDHSFTFPTPKVTSRVHGTNLCSVMCAPSVATCPQPTTKKAVRSVLPAATPAARTEQRSAALSPREARVGPECVYEWQKKRISLNTPCSKSMAGLLTLGYAPSAAAQASNASMPMPQQPSRVSANGGDTQRMVRSAAPRAVSPSVPVTPAGRPKLAPQARVGPQFEQLFRACVEQQRQLLWG